MDAPTRRRLIAAGGLILAAPQSALAAAAKPRVAIKTPRGVIIVELEPRRAPLTVASGSSLCRSRSIRPIKS